MKWNRTTRRALLCTGVGLVLVVGCSENSTVTAHEHHESPLHHHSLLLSPNASVEVQQAIAQLRRWSAPFHNLEKAAEAHYTVNIGCIDEVLMGVDPSVARGMGYHVTRGDENIVDGRVDLFQPQFLVYAPHPRDAELPKEERLEAARLAGFDYFVPAALWPHPDPPEFFGEPFNWSEAFQGWMRHIYLWAHNPEGMFEDFNALVPLCTTHLDP
jgi:hypothetical protein